MTFEIESDVPLAPNPEVVAFICRRSHKSVASIRKFIAECGTKIVVQLGSRGGILRMDPEYPCSFGKDCLHCRDRMEKIRVLIENGK